MAPPVGADLSRRVLPVGIIVDGQYLPEVTMVSSTHRGLCTIATTIIPSQ
jgi:hypothetical protein